jgi:phosphomannomutase
MTSAIPPAVQTRERMERLLAGSSLTGLRIGLLRKGLPSERVPFGRIVAAGAETFALITPYKLPERQARELSPALRADLSARAKKMRLDAVITMEESGDALRLVDPHGRIVPGDILGQICAQFLEVQAVVAPSRVNSGLQQLGFKEVHLTEAVELDIWLLFSLQGAACGYDPEGVFYLSMDAPHPIEREILRDDLLPILAMLNEVKRMGSIGARLLVEPQRFTARIDLSQVVPRFKTDLDAALEQSLAALEVLMAEKIISAETTDTFRVEFMSGMLLHLIAEKGKLHVVIDATTPDVAEARLSLLVDAAPRLYGANEMRPDHPYLATGPLATTQSDGSSEVGPKTAPTDNCQ